MALVLLPVLGRTQSKPLVTSRSVSFNSITYRLSTLLVFSVVKVLLATLNADRASVLPEGPVLSDRYAAENGSVLPDVLLTSLAWVRLIADPVTVLPFFTAIRSVQ